MIMLKFYHNLHKLVKEREKKMTKVQLCSALIHKSRVNEYLLHKLTFYSHFGSEDRLAFYGEPFVASYIN